MEGRRRGREDGQLRRFIYDAQRLVSPDVCLPALGPIGADQRPEVRLWFLALSLPPATSLGGFLHSGFLPLKADKSCLAGVNRGPWNVELPTWIYASRIGREVRMLRNKYNTLPTYQYKVTTHHMETSAHRSLSP